MQKYLKLGARIYLKKTPLAARDIVELVEELNSNSVDRLNYYKLEDENAKSTRTKKFDQKVFEKDFDGPGVSYVSFFDKRINEYSNEEYSIYLTIYPNGRRIVPPYLLMQFKE